MKAITIFYNVANDDEVLALLEGQGVTEYSKLPRTAGRGAVSGPRLDDHVWPGYNVTIIVIVSDALAPKLMAALQSFRDGPVGRRTGIYAYQTAVEAVLAPPAGK